MKEIWKDIPNFEGLYQASNLGKIKTLEHTTTQKHWQGGTSHRHYKEHIIKGSINSRGYINISLRDKNNKRKSYLAHVIIAKTFLPTINNKNCVNHKDGNKLNNKVENLEWVNHKENTQHAIKNNLIKHNNFKMYDKNGKFIKKFDNYNEIEKYLNRNIHSDLIRRCVNKQRKSAYGYIWTN